MEPSSDYNRNAMTGGEEKFAGGDVKLTAMQKTFMKSSIGMRGRKKQAPAPAQKTQQSQASVHVDVLSQAEYSDMIDAIERPSKYVNSPLCREVQECYSGFVPKFPSTALGAVPVVLELSSCLYLFSHTHILTFFFPFISYLPCSPRHRTFTVYL